MYKFIQNRFPRSSWPKVVGSNLWDTNPIQRKKWIMVQKRHLNIQEYQSKMLMEHHGLQVQRFRVVETPEEAFQAAKGLQAKEFVVKAQILAGGRGKGIFDNGLKGGVQLCQTPEQVSSLASRMLGAHLITKQTTSTGSLVQRLMIAESVKILAECYVSIIMDRESGGPVFLVSPCGGMDIEKIAEEIPEKIRRETITCMDNGPTAQQLEELAQFLISHHYSHINDDEIDEKQRQNSLRGLMEQLRASYGLFLALDAVQFEVNPLAWTKTSGWVCVDAKLTIDESASFRQRSLWEMQDRCMLDEREKWAEEQNLSYVALDGNIGCLVNGAGLAMGTMDLIKLHGGSPANFLDIGGTASESSITAALSLLSNDPQVDAILVNIFGGIVQCDTIARGILNTLQTLHTHKPIIVRLAGTHASQALQLLQCSNRPMQLASNLDEAARLAVQAGSISSRPTIAMEI